MEMEKNASLSQYLFAVKELTAREVKRRYARSRIGIVWSVLNPLLTMIIMSMIFSYMFRKSIVNYPVYYLTGSVFWSFFREATDHSVSALVDNRTLLMKSKLPRQTFVLARIYTALVNFGYTCVAFVLIVAFYVIQGKLSIRPSLILLPADVFLFLLFATGIGYALSIIYVFFADIKYLYSVLITLWMYLSALFYPVDNLPEYLKQAIGYNPVYLAIAIARCIVLDGSFPEPAMWGRLLIYAVISISLGIWIFKKNENNIMQII